MARVIGFLKSAAAFVRASVKLIGEGRRRQIEAEEFGDLYHSHRLP